MLLISGPMKLRLGTFHEWIYNICDITQIRYAHIKLTNGNIFFSPNQDLTQRGIKDINVKNPNDFLLEYTNITELYV